MTPIFHLINHAQQVQQPTKSTNMKSSASSVSSKDSRSIVIWSL